MDQGREPDHEPDHGSGRAPDRGRERWAASRVAAVLAAGAAVALLAIAAAGSSASPFGRGATAGRARAPDALVWGLLLTLMLAGLLVGVAALVLALVWGEPIKLPRRGRWQLRSTLVLLILVALAMWLQANRQPSGPQPAAPAAPPPGSEPMPTIRVDSAGWVPLLVVTALLVAWVTVGAVAESRRRRASPESTEAERLAALVDEALRDLAAETDPRRAVIAAYDVMERGLATAGLPRRPGETPLEHTTRALLGAQVPAPPVRRLAALFERARFSPHPVDQAMRDQALTALDQVRAALRERAADAAEQPEPA